MVRDAEPGDADAIVDVRTRGWQAAYAHVFPPERLHGMPSDAGREFWQGWLRDPPARAATVVAEGDGEVIGFASTGPAHGEACGELYAIYVRPDHWRAGVGRALLAAAEQRLVAYGFDEAILWVLDDNPRARRFYEAAGWQADGGEKHETFLETEVRELRYRMPL